VQHYIKILIAQGEHQQLDFKFEISDAKKIARSLVAFANTDGGRLLVGVKDNGVIAGVRSDEEVYMIETAAHIYCKPQVDFIVETHRVDGRMVLEVIVEKSIMRPHLAPGKENKWTAYLRVADENIVANNVIQKVWKRLMNPDGVYLKYTDAEKLLLTYIEQYGAVSFSKACRVAQVSKNKTENMLANLIAIGILVPMFSNQQTTYGIKTIGNFTY
jgi:predicted HTH transcriptional regulator